MIKLVQCFCAAALVGALLAPSRGEAGWSSWQAVAATSCEVLSGAGAVRNAVGWLSAPTDNNLLVSCPVPTSNRLLFAGRTTYSGPLVGVTSLRVHLHKTYATEITARFCQTYASNNTGVTFQKCSPTSMPTGVSTSGGKTGNVTLAYDAPAGSFLFEPAFQASSSWWGFPQVEISLKKGATLHGLRLGYN